jgi:hypothetical protein
MCHHNLKVIELAQTTTTRGMKGDSFVSFNFLLTSVPAKQLA